MKFSNNQHLFRWLGLGVVLLLLAAGLAWISSGFINLTGWASFLGVLLLATGMLWVGWRVVGGENSPKWLLGLLLAAALLRLALGVFWSLALPSWGYDTEVQRAGYVMEDAFNRDSAAWQLSQSETSLWAAFRGYSASDQYGGLLFLSAAVYRYLGSAVHQPLLMIVVTSAFSALAVIFTWAFVQRAWGSQAAKIAAWLMALYPEAALLGSSQMREAFTVTLTAMALYGTLRFWKARSPANFALVVAPLAAGIPLSWPFTGLLAATVLVVWLALDEWRALRNVRLVLALIFALAVAVGLLWVFVDLQSSWVFQVVKWQKYISEASSGWVQRQFERMPVWAHMPFLLIYGVFRPLLPAALIADGALVWRVVVIWRALGWTVLLALLGYATLLALRNGTWRKLVGGMLGINWLVVLVASFRSGGDSWDNPRYRATFASLQVALAAWALMRQRQMDDPWLRRVLVTAGMLVLWFIPWYVRRYPPIDLVWPIVDLPQVVGLGLVSGVLYAIWDWARP